MSLTPEQIAVRLDVQGVTIANQQRAVTDLQSAVTQIESQLIDILNQLGDLRNLLSAFARQIALVTSGLTALEDVCTAPKIAKLALSGGIGNRLAALEAPVTDQPESQDDIDAAKDPNEPDFVPGPEPTSDTTV